MAIIIPISKTVVIEFALLLSFKNLSIIQISKKLQIKAGLKIIKGKNKLAPVMYINPGKKLGFASKLWLLIIRLNINAWVKTKIAAKKMLADDENAFSKSTSISKRANGSKKSKFKWAGVS